MNVLDEVAGEMIPNRRITANSFRLLTARLKKKPTAFAQTELLPEPAILAPLEIVEETVISAPVAEVEQQEDYSHQTSKSPGLKSLRKSHGPGSPLQIR